MSLKLGKTPARPGAMKLALSNYLNKPELPRLPPRFGNLSAWSAMRWGMYANDKYGCCVFSGFGHQVKMWAATARSFTRSAITLE
jgi:hypothetical protein